MTITMLGKQLSSALALSNHHVHLYMLLIAIPITVFLVAIPICTDNYTTKPNSTVLALIDNFYRASNS